MGSSAKSNLVQRWGTCVSPRQAPDRLEKDKRVDLITNFRADGSRKLKFGGLVEDPSPYQAHTTSAKTIVRGDCPVPKVWLVRS